MKIMTHEQYVFDILDNFSWEICNFLNKRHERKLQPQLQLLDNMHMDFEKYQHSCKIHRYGDPLNILEITLEYNFIDDDMDLFFTFNNKRWVLKESDCWIDMVSKMFETSILPNYYGFHPNKFVTDEDMCQANYNHLEYDDMVKMTDMWGILDYKPHKIGSIKELQGSCFMKDRQVKSLFNLCFYQLSSNELQYIRQQLQL